MGYRKFSINGVIVEALTVKELADVLGKARNTLLNYERVGIFPNAPIRYRDVRYYPISLAEALVPLVAKIPRHKKIDQSLVVEINKVFNDERKKLCRK